MGEMVEVAILVAMIVAAMIAFGALLYWLTDQIEGWIKRSRDGLDS